jgi:integrase
LPAPFIDRLEALVIEGDEQFVGELDRLCHISLPHRKHITHMSHVDDMSNMWHSPSYDARGIGEREGTGMLTEGKCKAAMPGSKSDGSPKPAMLHDGHGLYLQISPGANGATKSWVYRYSLAGRGRVVGLGAYPGISLAEARKVAAAARAERARGLDPATEKHRRLDAAAAAIATKQTKTAPVMTFDQVAAAYIAAHASSWSSAKHQEQWETTLATYASPVIGRMDVAAVDEAAVLAVLEKIWADKRPTAMRLRGRISKVIGYAMARGYRPRGANPAAWVDGLQHSLAGKRPKVEHHPALPYADAPAFMAALRSDDRTVARALEFTILTAARAGETLGARWCEIDLQAHTWTVPADRMKMDREHISPLSERACEILVALKGDREAAGDEYVFADPRSADVGALPLTSNAVLRAAQAIAADVTVHGFRSTFRDWAGDKTDAPREIAEAALAHVVGGVEGAYRRGTREASQPDASLVRLPQRWRRHPVSAAGLIAGS